MFAAAAAADFFICSKVSLIEHLGNQIQLWRIMSTFIVAACCDLIVDRKTLKGTNRAMDLFSGRGFAQCLNNFY